jgi:hypothetical protein
MKNNERSNKPNPPGPEIIKNELRTNTSQYTEFADRMIRAVYGKSRYGAAADMKLFDGLISKSQEAFTLLLYENGYNNWVWASTNDRGGTTSETASNTTDSGGPGYGYTEKSKDSLPSRNGGWSNEGMKKFNDLYKRVGEDRLKDKGGFEQVYKRHRKDRSPTSRKRKRCKDGPMHNIQISDDLGDLMSGIGSNDEGPVAGYAGQAYSV